MRFVVARALHFLERSIGWIVRLRDYSKEILSLYKSTKNDKIYINLATF
jgi:hypothetical protein